MDLYKGGGNSIKPSTLPSLSQETHTFCFISSIMTTWLETHLACGTSALKYELARKKKKSAWKLN